MADAAAAANPDLAQILQEHEANKKTTTIPIFYGTAKDTISGKNLIKRINQAAQVANWNDQRKLNELINAVRATAQDNLDAILETMTGEQNWTNVVKAFLMHYDPKNTEKASCTVIADLHQKPGELVGDYYGRVNTHFRQIRDNRPALTYTPSEAELNATPEAQREGLRNAIQRASNLGYQHMQQLIFTAGLQDRLRHKVMEKACTSLWACYAYASELETIQSDKEKKAKLNAVRHPEDEAVPDQPQDELDRDDWETEEEFNAINAVRVRRGMPPRPRPKFFRRPNASGPATGSSNTNNGNKKDYRCRYCKKAGHSQAECRKRIREGGLCVDEAGKPWKNQPKVNDVKDQNQPTTLNCFRNL